MFLLKTRFLAVAVCFLAVAECVLAGFAVSTFVRVTPEKTFVVVVDAGHGGVDGGVVGASGVKESDLNLDYALCLGEMFSAVGAKVVYTRTTKDGLYGLAQKGFKRRDMARRAEIIVGAEPDVVVSVHMNKFPQSSRKGAQVFFQKGADSALAQSIQTTLNAFSGNGHAALAGDFYVCRVSPCSAVIVEFGFLSNSEDEQNLQDSAYRNEICAAVFRGVMLYLYSL